MTAAITSSAAEAAPVPARCAEIVRTNRGYERCHRNEHDPGTSHHVRDRGWSTGKNTPRLKLGQPCGKACTWPEQVAAYWGGAPKQSGAAMHERAGMLRGPSRPGGEP
jgi:hypothetical protein